MSKNNAIHKLVHAAAAAGLIIAPPAAGAVALTVGGAVLAAPAAQAAASFGLTANLSAPSSDPSAVTASFTSTVATDSTIQVVIKDAAGNQVRAIDITVPATPSPGHYDGSRQWVPAVPEPYTYPYTITVLPGQSAQAFAPGSTPTNGTWFGNVYRNTSTPSLPSFAAVKPTQVGNTITIPQAPTGAWYAVSGGAGKPLVAGQVITLDSSLTSINIVELFDASKVTLTGATGPWPFNYVPPAPAQVTAPGPELVSGNLWKIPAYPGIHYVANGKTVPAGDYYVPVGGATIVAVSDSAQLQLVGQTSWPLPYVTPPQVDEGTKKVLVCRIDGQSGKYGAVTVPVASLQTPDKDDIFPGATYRGGDDYTVTIPPLNWTVANQKIYEDNCVVETPPPSGDHGGNTGGDNGNHAGNTGGQGGGNTTVTPPAGNTTSSTHTDTTVSTSSSNSTKQVTQQSAATTDTQSAEEAPAIKADTAADPSSPLNLGLGGGLAAVVLVAVGAGVALRRPRHRADEA